MAAVDPNDSGKESIEDKRKRCLLGELPENFLRLPTQSQPTNYGYPVVQPQYVKTKQLEMTIVQARLAKNYGLTRMDPYCKVRVGHKTYETITAFNGSKNPYWNKKFMCPIPKGVESLQVSIFDEKTVSTDDEIAFAVIPFPQEIFEGNIVDKWYQLSGRQGDNQEGQINIVLSIREVQVLQTPMYQNVHMMPGGYVMPPGIMQQQAPQHQFQQQQQPIQQVQQPAVVITDEDVNQLHEMFPGIEKDVIKTVLEEQGGNKETCISALLSLTDDVTPNTQQPEPVEN